MEKQGYIMITKILPAIGLLALSHTAYSAIIETNDYTTLNWSGECSDCVSIKGDDSYSLSNYVSGNVILDGYVSGEEFSFDESNFVSFQYNGPSNHVDQLVIHNANFNLSDQWVDESDFVSSVFANGGDLFTVPGVTLNPEAQINGYTHFGENMDVTGWISADLSSYSLDLTFDTFVPVNEMGEYIKFSDLDGESTTFNKQTFNIFYESDGDWGINVGNVPYDLGRGAAVSLPTTAVPEPSTLAIFALSLFGLASRRKLK